VDGKRVAILLRSAAGKQASHKIELAVPVSEKERDAMVTSGRAYHVPRFMVLRDRGTWLTAFMDCRKTHSSVARPQKPKIGRSSFEKLSWFFNFMPLPRFGKLLNTRWNFEQFSLFLVVARRKLLPLNLADFRW
jgi:hypothetical protein